MVNKLIGGLIAIVIGLALLPVVADFADDVATTYSAENFAPLVELLPILYVIILFAGVVGFIATRK
jgi:hypothetical protein